jgi:hypothetical protein
MGTIELPQNVKEYLAGLSKSDAAMNALVYSKGMDRAEEYIKRVEREYEYLSPELGGKVCSILDIGCGLAGVTAMIAMNYNTELVSLIDGDKTDTPVPGFHESTTPWADVSLGIDVVSYNCDPEITKGFKVGTTYDLVFSSRGLGLHFPFSKYIHGVDACTDVDSILIVDVRKSMEAEAISYLKKYRFISPTLVDEHKKSSRWKFVKI